MKGQKEKVTLNLESLFIVRVLQKRNVEEKEEKGKGREVLRWSVRQTKKLKQFLIKVDIYSRLALSVLIPSATHLKDKMIS